MASIRPLATMCRAVRRPLAHAALRQSRRFLPTATTRLAYSAPSSPGGPGRPTGQEEGDRQEEHGLARQDAAADDVVPLQLDRRPYYKMTFTCNMCQTRSRHDISKQGYHHGSVLATCPECRSRHVISDHLRIFANTPQGYTVEDLMRDHGRVVKKGTLGEDGNLEFWEDGSVTPHITDEELAAANK